MKEKLSNKNWYPYTVAACLAVTLYVALTHLDALMGAVRTFGGFFKPLCFGCVMAYLMNPLAMIFQKKLFRGIRREGVRWVLSVTLALLTVLLALLFLLGTLIPQLVGSIQLLVGNMDGYLASLNSLLDTLNLSNLLNLDQLFSNSEGFLKRVIGFLADNLSGIASAGKGLVNLFIALILSVYLLNAKQSLKAGSARLLRALMSEPRYDAAIAFLGRCDTILIRYITFSLLDAAIVGGVNALFMLACGMQYAGLVSMIAGVTNLIPTFGPMIGGVIGALVLLLVNPIHALLFIAFTVVLQFLDGYVIKPKLFGDSLGVSGLLILTAVVVFGNMFGVVGILLAIPIAAILDFVYEEALLPALEQRGKTK